MRHYFEYEFPSSFDDSTTTPQVKVASVPRLFFCPENKGKHKGTDFGGEFPTRVATSYYGVGGVSDASVALAKAADVAFLAPFLEGELPRAQLVTFESHMGDCPQCVTYLDTYREMVRLGKELLCPADDAIPDEVPSDLIDAILAARSAEDQTPAK